MRATQGPSELPEGWEWARLDDVCQVNPRKPQLKRGDEAPTSFLPMSGVDEVDGVASRLEVRPFKEVARGFTYFEEEDVLFAKITPSMQNGKSAVARGLLDGLGFGSTEFHVLRPGPRVTADWVHRFVRRWSFRQEAKEHFRGAVGQQRVPRGFLEEHLIPVPPTIEVQNRIVARIEALLVDAKEARALLETMRRDTDRVMDAVLEEVFARLDQAGSDSRLLKEVLRTKPQYGTSQKAYDVLPGTPILRMGNIINGRISFEDLKYVVLDPREEAKFLLRRGDILFNRTNSAKLVGKSAVYESSEATVFASFLIRLVVDPTLANPHYVVAYINSGRGRAYIRSQMTRAIGQVNVNATKIAAMPIPIPKLRTQEHIVAHLESVRVEVDEIRRSLNRDATLLNRVEQSVLEDAFRGKL
ncbi:restriction endonuclease subunit S [Rubrobacter tropicus]|nr:restriction endonuclease subunit S [Rubrobacter tropicus]